MPYYWPNRLDSFWHSTNFFYFLIGVDFVGWSLRTDGKVFYCQDLSRGESITAVCGDNYQLHLVMLLM